MISKFMTTTICSRPPTLTDLKPNLLMRQDLKKQGFLQTQHVLYYARKEPAQASQHMHSLHTHTEENNWI